MQCSECGRVIIGENPDGARKLRARILLFEESGTVAVCPGCKARIPVPVVMADASRRSSNLNHVILQQNGLKRA